MKRAVILAIALGCLACGCSLGEVRERGDSCPEGIRYIHSEENCTEGKEAECVLEFNGKTEKFDFSENFKIRQCPWQYPVCRGFELGGDIVYACEESVKTVESCIDSELECRSEEDENKVVCINPGSNKTCGAHYCNAESNYGALNCALNGAVCEDNGFGKYACVKISGENNGKVIICASGKEVDPSDAKTCGAGDCSQPNYGGTVCNGYATCSEVDGRYQCMPIQCGENECMFTDEEGKPVCGNSKYKCGSHCDNCTSIHQNGYCLESGACAVTECLETETPVYEGGVIRECSVK